MSNQWSEVASKKQLAGRLEYSGLEHISFTKKKEMRELALRGGPYSDKEQADLLDYYQTDVDALVALLPEVALKISIDYALIRVCYMKAVARMESVGIPIDLPLQKLLKRLQTN